MQERELELRTKENGLLMCKMCISKEDALYFEVKNGKKKEHMSLENFVAEINKALTQIGQKLNIEKA